jgi:hypothetical protein
VAAGAAKVLQRFEIIRPGAAAQRVRLDLAPVDSALPEAPVKSAGAVTAVLPMDPG